MNPLRLSVHDLIPPILRRRHEYAATRRLVRRYERGQEDPWSPAYYAYRHRRIAEYVADPALVSRIAFGGSLDSGHGRALDERSVELPWALGRLGSLPQGARVLDAGSALNHSFVLDAPVFSRLDLNIATLRPERDCFWRRGISYLFADLRALPIVDAHYDAIVSISTLEHVGFDNALFGAATQPTIADSEAHSEAIRELARVLRPGGELLFSVPFGRYERHPTFQQFDQPALARAIVAFGPSTTRQVDFFRYTASGWIRSDAAACADAEYVPWIMQTLSDREPRFPKQGDGAVAARAVACVTLSKPGQS